MKNLRQYTEKATSELIEDCGAFFAFGIDQFKEGKAKSKHKDEKKWVHFGAGLYCPKIKQKELNKGLDNTQKLGIKQDIKENGIENIIRRELNNYECYYVDSVEDAIKPLKKYGVAKEQIQKVYNKFRDEEIENYC